MKPDELRQRLKFSEKRDWRSVKSGAYSVWATGWVYYGGDVLRGESFADHVCRHLESENSLVQFLDRIDGNFAFIAWDGFQLYAAVDRVRSIPLTYRRDPCKFEISDDVTLIASDSEELNEESTVELALSGLVSGSLTIYSELSSLQSGEILFWKPGVFLKTQRYYEWLCEYDSGETEEDLSSEYFKILEDVFRRFIAFLDGRQVVVALSAGLDSKLVVGMLRYFHYNNVICYTYGKKDSKEAIGARAVAQDFDYSWSLTEYSGHLWADTLNDENLHDYWKFASNGVSLPHYWDWPSLNIIRDKGLAAKDAVFVTGISGDFVAGNHLKVIFDPRLNSDPTDFIKLMCTKHYSLWENLINRPQLRTVAEEKIKSVTKFDGNSSEEYIASIYEHWEWQERQSKYIVNLVRQHEYFGYSWAMPLWDRKIMDFWRKVPLRLKKGQYLYQKSVSENYPEEMFTSHRPLTHWSREPIVKRLETGRWGTGLSRRKLLNHLQSVPALGIVIRKYLQIKRHIRLYKTHSVAVEKGFGFLRYVFKDLDKRHTDSLVLKEFMMKLYGLDPRRIK